MNTAIDLISEIGIIPVVKLEHPERDALPLARALIAGGVRVAEITFRAKGAAEAIKAMSKKFPELLVGAGTVLSAEQAAQAVSFGARFIVSPGLDVSVLQACQKLGVLALPGCLTPTEIQAALALGLSTLKFFPAAEAGGPAFLKAMHGPFPSLRFVPTGGVSLQNLGDYLKLPFVAACGGSYMVKPEFLNEGRFDEVTRLCAESRGIVVKIREESRRVS